MDFYVLNRSNMVLREHFLNIRLTIDDTAFQADVGQYATGTIVAQLLPLLPLFV